MENRRRSQRSAARRKRPVGKKQLPRRAASRRTCGGVVDVLKAYMLLTVDTSAVLSVLLNEPTKSSVIQATLGAELITPASLDWEIVNAFSSLFKRRSLLLEQAEKALQDLPSIKIERKPVSLIHAVKLAST